MIFNSRFGINLDICFRAFLAALPSSYDPVVGLEGVHEKGQEIPRSQDLWQVLGALSLHNVHDHHKDTCYGEWDANYRKDNVIEGNSHDEPGEGEEHEDEVRYGEPSVVGRRVAEDFAHGKRDPHEGNRVKDEDAEHVEEEVHERNLQSILYRQRT